VTNQTGIGVLNVQPHGPVMTGLPATETINTAIALSPTPNAQITLKDH